MSEASSKAYQEAQALVKRRPEGAQAHFAMGYVYCYAGMLVQSGGAANSKDFIDLPIPPT